MDMRNKILIVSVLVFVSAAVANSQGICNVTFEGLQSCIPAAKPPNPEPPSAECCDSLRNADYCCLYGYRNSSLLPSMGVDPNLVMEIPDKCNIAHPPPSSCNN